MKCRTLPPLPVRCPACGTDQYTRAHLRAQQHDAAWTLALRGPSPEFAAASLRVVAAMGRQGRRLACGQQHDAEGRP